MQTRQAYKAQLQVRGKERLLEWLHMGKLQRYGTLMSGCVQCLACDAQEVEGHGCRLLLLPGLSGY